MSNWVSRGESLPTVINPLDCCMTHTVTTKEKMLTRREGAPWLRCSSLPPFGTPAPPPWLGVLFWAYVSPPLFRRDNDGAGMLCTLIFHKTDNSVSWRLTVCWEPSAATQSLCQPDIHISPRAHLSTITGYINRSSSLSVPLAPCRVKTAG